MVIHPSGDYKPCYNPRAMHTPNEYMRGVTVAAAISILLHTAAFVGGAALLPEHKGPGPEPEPDPIEINFLQEEEPDRQQLVDTVSPSDTPPDDSRFIARENTQATDTELKDGDNPGPAAEIESPLASVARSSATPQEPAPPMPEVAPAEENVEESIPEAPVHREVVVPNAKPVEKKEQASEEKPRQEQAERMQMAKVDPAPSTPPAEPPSRSRGSVKNEVREKGFASYAATKDLVAPYLENIKRRVEKEWREALYLRYTGSVPTDVDVDCEISADGKVVSVRYVASPMDRIFGSICRDAIRKAGPFPPFPFEVPEIYRNQNLEIRWHFSFL